MRFNLFGRTMTIGKTAEPAIETVPVKKGLTDTLGGFLDFFRAPLSSEKQISNKLIRSNEEWVFINVSTLAEVVSSLEFELFQFKMRSGKVELEPIEEHELLNLLNQFNDATTKTDAIYNTEAHIDLAGESFWLLEGGANNKKPTKIYMLQPDNVTLELGDFTKQSSRLIKSYDYKVIIDGKEVKQSYRPDEIIHIKAPNPANPYRGKSVVEAIATTIDTDNYAQESLKMLFKNGMVGDFFLTTEKKATPEQLKNLAAQFKAAYTGVKNFWKVPILYGGLKPEKLMSTGREMQLIELEEWFRNKIMSAFKNTRASLGIDDEVNRSTAEASLINWKRSVIAPKMARIVNALNEYLVPRYGDNLLLGFKDPVPEDRDNEIKEAVELYKNRIITRNEARQIMDYEEVEGGDEFATTVNPLSQDFGKQIAKRLPSLKYVNYRQIFRKAGMYTMAKEYLELKAKARPLAEKIIKNRKHKETTEEVREHAKFSNEQVWQYWEKQIDIVEFIEKVFANVAYQFSAQIIRQGIRNLGDPDRRKTGNLVDKEELLDQAVNKFMPSLTEVVVLSGQHANRLIGIDQPYIPTKAVNTREELRDQILLFAGSMIETDVDLMAEILAQGLDEGLSISQIRRNITSKFDKFSPEQAERVTRTEVLKASNLGAQDAFEQSGVVVGKQWLTAMDDRVDPLCASLNGKIIDLRSDYFKKGDSVEAGGKLFKLDYSNTPYPPIHVSCRCTLLPIIEGQEGFDIRSFEAFQELKIQVKELEDKVDKRTKEYKETKKLYEESEKSHQETKGYAKELEKLAGVGDEE